MISGFKTGYGVVQELASVFATEASTILRGVCVDLSGHQLSARIEEACQIIALTKGVLIRRAVIAEDEGYTVLRASEQHTGRPLREEAIGLVGSAQRSTRAGRIEPGVDGG